MTSKLFEVCFVHRFSSLINSTLMDIYFRCRQKTCTWNRFFVTMQLPIFDMEYREIWKWWKNKTKQQCKKCMHKTTAAEKWLILLTKIDIFLLLILILSLRFRMCEHCYYFEMRKHWQSRIELKTLHRVFRACGTYGKIDWLTSFIVVHFGVVHDGGCCYFDCASCVCVCG